MAPKYVGIYEIVEVLPYHTIVLGKMERRQFRMKAGLNYMWSMQE